MASTNNEENIKSTKGKLMINMNKRVANDERQAGNKRVKIFNLKNNGKCKFKKT